MSLLLTVRKSLQRPGVAGGLLVLAGGIWAILLWTRMSPENGHVEAGVEFARQHQGPKAEKEWLQATRLNARDPRPWLYLGEYYQAIQQWPAAVDALHHLAALKPDTPHLAAQLASCSLNMGDERAAYGYAEQSLQQRPDDPDTLRLLCGLLAHTGEDQKRLTLLRRLVALQPDSLPDKLLLAQALVSKRLFTEAHPLLDQALAHDPENLEACALRGMIVFNEDPSPQGMAKAEQDLLHVVSSPRFAAFAHFYLGKIYKRQGQPARAIPHLESAAQAFPDKREIFFALADAYALTGQAQKAAMARKQFEALRQEESRIDTLTTLCAANPDNFDNQLELAQKLFHHKEYRKAEAHLTRAQSLRPGDARLHLLAQQLAIAAGGQVQSATDENATLVTESPSAPGGSSPR